MAGNEHPMFLFLRQRRFVPESMNGHRVTAKTLCLPGAIPRILLSRIFEDKRQEADEGPVAPAPRFFAGYVGKAGRK